MDSTLMECVTAIVVAVIGYVIGIIKERQYDLALEDRYSKYKLIFDVSGSVLKVMDEKLYTEIEEAIAKMDEAYKSPTFTTAMFNQIVRESKDVFDRAQELLESRS